MFIVIKCHREMLYEDVEWPEEGWIDNAGEVDKCWVFENHVDAQELASYMNSPHHDYPAWIEDCEWVWVAMPLEQFKGLVPDAMQFIPAPDIKAQLHEDIAAAKRTSMESLRQPYRGCLDPRVLGEGRNQNSYDLEELEQAGPSHVTA